IQISTLSVSVSLSATVTLVCLFAPKVYIIYFHPEKNIRKLTMNSGPGSKSRYATCKSPPESYARHSSSMETDCVITNAMATQSTQPSSTLKAILETNDSRSGQVLEGVTYWKLRTGDPEDLRENTLLLDHFLIFFSLTTMGDNYGPQRRGQVRSLPFPESKFLDNYRRIFSVVIFCRCGSMGDMGDRLLQSHPEKCGRGPSQFHNRMRGPWANLDHSESAAASNLTSTLIFQTPLRVHSTIPMAYPCAEVNLGDLYVPVEDMMEDSQRPPLMPSKETTTINALIPRRDSKDFAEPIVVARLQPVPANPTDGESSLRVPKQPAYQALISPMPLLLDNLAVSIASVPACLCEEEELRNDTSPDETDISDTAFGNERCYSSRPTPSELSINAPDCQEDDTDSANIYVYHNQASQLMTSSTSIQNGRVSNTETDSIADLWQQVKPYGVVDGRIPSGAVRDHNPRCVPSSRRPYDIISAASRRLDEEKISSV
ncbi:unnamed protein product, partial [Hymenolepis diminuta]